MTAPHFWARYTPLPTPPAATSLVTRTNPTNKCLTSTYCVPCSVLGGTGDTVVTQKAMITVSDNKNNHGTYGGHICNEEA